MNVTKKVGLGVSITIASIAILFLPLALGLMAGFPFALWSDSSATDYTVEDYVTDWEMARDVAIEVKTCAKFGMARADPYDVRPGPGIYEVWKCPVRETATTYAFMDRCYVVDHDFSSVIRGIKCKLVHRATSGGSRSDSK